MNDKIRIPTPIPHAPIPAPDDFYRYDWFTPISPMGLFDEVICMYEVKGMFGTAEWPFDNEDPTLEPVVSRIIDFYSDNIKRVATCLVEITRYNCDTGHSSIWLRLCFERIPGIVSLYPTPGNDTIRFLRVVVH